jgi:hypothetical protein
VGIPLTVGFKAFTEPSAITEPLHILSFVTMELRLSRILLTNFSFTRWNFGYHGAFHELFFHTMELWLSRSLSRTFLSHDGTLSITEPFTNFSFARWNFGYQATFLKLSRIFHMVELTKTHDLGEDSFHIYHKEYLHRIHLVKNLAS